MRVAVVGSGVSGLVAARRLHAARHDVTVYEAGEWIGGHVNTVDVPGRDGRTRAVDTGFIVFNETTYPHFCELLRELGVDWQASEMSFSVRRERDGLEYNGASLGGLFAQRRNALRPSFWGMLRDVLRFFREAPDALAAEDELTLGAFLERGRYSRAFVDDHLLPMCAAVWSARPEGMRAFPMRYLVQFFHNHGFLRVSGRPSWLVVRGGSRRYVEALVAPFRERIRLRTPIARVEPVGAGPAGGVRLRTPDGGVETFDRVVLATHADQSLRLLDAPTPLEREVLGAFAYQRNEALLHTDTALLPRSARARASWNYHVCDPAAQLPTVTYWMNRLQGLDGDEQYLVTLNRGEAIDPARVLRRFVYHHPIYSTAAVRAQRRHAEIDGARGVHFCGAYWGWGFHEDGVRSALEVARRLAREVAA